MALMERFFPVHRRSFNFFDMFDQMDREFAEMEKEMFNMRQSMFQLIPRDFGTDVKDNMIQPNLPIVQDQGLSKLKLNFDVHKFKPEEVVVKIVGNNILQIEAAHESKTDNSLEKMTYFRQYQLPAGVSADSLKPSLTQDGVLTIEAKAPDIPATERLVPIEYKKADA